MRFAINRQRGFAIGQIPGGAIRFASKLSSLQIWLMRVMATPDSSNPHHGRPFLGLHMRCCNTYIRAYLNAQKNAYVGRCPRCGVPVRVEVVAEGGSAGRFFSAG